MTEGIVFIGLFTAIVLPLICFAVVKKNANINFIYCVHFLISFFSALFLFIVSSYFSIVKYNLKYIFYLLFYFIVFIVTHTVVKYIKNKSSEKFINISSGELIFINMFISCIGIFCYFLFMFFFYILLIQILGKA